MVSMRSFTHAAPSSRHHGYPDRSGGAERMPVRAGWHRVTSPTPPITAAVTVGRAARRRARRPGADPPAGGARRAVAPRRPAGPRRLRRRAHPGRGVRRPRHRAGRRRRAPAGGTRCPTPAALQDVLRARRRARRVPWWSPTTTATARSRPGPGGCCAGRAPADRVAVLDGGCRRGSPTGRPTTAERRAARAPGDVVVRPGAHAGARRRRAPRSWPARRAARRAGRRRATAARPSRSTRWPATSRAPRNLPADRASPDADGRCAARAAELARAVRRSRRRRPGAGAGRRLLRIGRHRRRARARRWSTPGCARPTTRSRCTPGLVAVVGRPGRPVATGATVTADPVTDRVADA